MRLSYPGWFRLGRVRIYSRGIDEVAPYVPKRVKSRSMIWNSIPFMTAIDLVIIAVTIYAIWRCRLIGPSKRASLPQIGLRLIALDLMAVCLFYFADLV